MCSTPAHVNHHLILHESRINKANQLMAVKIVDIKSQKHQKDLSEPGISPGTAPHICHKFSCTRPSSNSALFSSRHGARTQYETPQSPHCHLGSSGSLARLPSGLTAYGGTTAPDALRSSATLARTRRQVLGQHARCKPPRPRASYCRTSPAL